MTRRVFITGQFGRPNAIERQLHAATLGMSHRVYTVMHWPNLDHYDPLEETFVNPTGKMSSEFASMETFYAAMDARMREFEPDVVITGFLDDARVGDFAKTWGEKVPTFCVNKEASRFEWDRFYAKKRCAELGVPVSRTEYFEDRQAAMNYALGMVDGAVIKTAAGRLRHTCYAAVCKTAAAAHEAVRTWEERSFPIVIEERLEGIEIAFAGIVDYRSQRFIPMLTDFEYSKLLEGDRGPETPEMGIHDVAGMGRRPIVEIFERLMPWFRDVKYVGWFDASCIYNQAKNELKAYEFMTRLGSSQTENLCAMLKTDFVEITERLAAGNLHEVDIRWRHHHGVTVVAAVAGHPAVDAKVPQYTINGTNISRLIRGRHIAHTTSMLSRFESNFDRSGKLYITGQIPFAGTGASMYFDMAHTGATGVLEEVEFPGMMWRRDIGHRWKDLQTRMILAEAGLLPGGWSL